MVTQQGSWRTKLKDYVTRNYGGPVGFRRKTSFNDITLNGLYRGTIPTPDTARRLHDIISDEEIQGYLRNFFEIDGWHNDFVNWLNGNNYTPWTFAHKKGYGPTTVLKWANGGTKNPFLIKGELRERAYRDTGLKWFAPSDEIGKYTTRTILPIGIVPNVTAYLPTTVTLQRGIDSLKARFFAIKGSLGGLEPLLDDVEIFLQQLEQEMPTFEMTPGDRAEDFKRNLDILIAHIQHYKNADESEKRELAKKIDQRALGIISSFGFSLYREGS